MGLNIIQSVDRDPGLDAEHDQVYSGDVSLFSDELKAELDALGWHVSDVDRFMFNT